MKSWDRLTLLTRESGGDIFAIGNCNQYQANQLRWRYDLLMSIIGDPTAEIAQDVDSKDERSAETALFYNKKPRTGDNLALSSSTLLINIF